MLYHTLLNPTVLSQLTKNLSHRWSLVIPKMGTQQIKKFIQSYHLDAEIKRQPAPIRTLAQVALAANLPSDNIVKTILLKGENNTIIACVLPRKCKLDLPKVQKLLKWKKIPRHLDYLESKTATGFPPGGIPPIGHPEHITIIIDKEVLIKEYIAAAAGDEFHLLKMKACDLRKLPNKIITAEICIK